MPKVVIIAEVQDPVKWEAGFRTHGELFRSYSITKPIEFAFDGNTVMIIMEPENLDTFKKSLETPATAEAMKFDGVKRETAKFYYPGKEFKL